MCARSSRRQELSEPQLTSFDRPDATKTGIIRQSRCCHAACFRSSCDVSRRGVIRLCPSASAGRGLPVVGLAAIKERSPSLDQITLDMQSLAVSKANTKVGDTPITMVVMGDAYLQRDKTDKPNRFVCLLSDNDKVVLTFFTEQ